MMCKSRPSKKNVLKNLGRKKMKKKERNYLVFFLTVFICIFPVSSFEKKKDLKVKQIRT